MTVIIDNKTLLGDFAREMGDFPFQTVVGFKSVESNSLSFPWMATTDFLQGKDHRAVSKPICKFGVHDLEYLMYW